MHPNVHDEKKPTYPYWRYKAEYPEKPQQQPTLESKLVTNEDEQKELDKEGGWVESPADAGIETAPGAAPDPAIAAKRKPPAASGNPASGNAEPKKANK